MVIEEKMGSTLLVDAIKKFAPMNLVLKNSQLDAATIIDLASFLKNANHGLSSLTLTNCAGNDGKKLHATHIDLLQKAVQGQTGIILNIQFDKPNAYYSFASAICANNPLYKQLASQEESDSDDELAFKHSF